MRPPPHLAIAMRAQLDNRGWELLTGVELGVTPTMDQRYVGPDCSGTCIKRHSINLRQATDSRLPPKEFILHHFIELRKP